MSITLTYYLAHSARNKLSKEASRADHNLRLLVGHANLLDSLMIQLAEAEREQEQWFNQTVRGAAEASDESRSSRHIQWEDTIMEEPEQDWDADDADSDSDSDSEYGAEEEEARIYVAPRTPSVPSITITPLEIDDDEDYDSEEDNEELALVRSPSRTLPELSDDSDDDSEDDSMPPSPPQATLEFSEQQPKQISTAYSQANQPLSETEQSSFFEDGYFLPQRTSETTPMMISSY